VPRRSARKPIGSPSRHGTSEFREVQYRWRRDEEGRLAYRLWMVKLIMGLDAEKCDHDEEPWLWGDAREELREGWYG
jgi:hypothetical protein